MDKEKFKSFSCLKCKAVLLISFYEDTIRFVCSKSHCNWYAFMGFDPKGINVLNSIKKDLEDVNIVLGQEDTFENEESYTSEPTKEFYLMYKPIMVDIGGVEFYKIDKENKKIIFDSPQTNFTVSYTYEGNTRIRGG